MLAAVKGYYDGKHIVMEEKIDLKKYMGRGEKLFHEDVQE